MAFLGLFKKKEPVAEPFTANPGFNPGGAQQNPFDPGLDSDSGLRLNSIGNQEVDSFGNPRPKASYEREFGFSQPQQMAAPNQDLGKDMQIILAKLDAIKAEVGSIDRRLEVIERQQSSQKRYSW